MPAGLDAAGVTRRLRRRFTEVQELRSANEKRRALQIALGKLFDFAWSGSYTNPQPRSVV